jgi:hypothetical protein
MGEFLSSMSESWVSMSEFPAFMGESRSSVFRGEFKKQQSYRKERNKIKSKKVAQFFMSNFF